MNSCCSEHSRFLWIEHQTCTFQGSMWVMQLTFRDNNAKGLRQSKHEYGKCLLPYGLDIGLETVFLAKGLFYCSAYAFANKTFVSKLKQVLKYHDTSTLLLPQRLNAVAVLLEFLPAWRRSAVMKIHQFPWCVLTGFFPFSYLNSLNQTHRPYWNGPLNRSDLQIQQLIHCIYCIWDPQMDFIPYVLPKIASLFEPPLFGLVFA